MYNLENQGGKNPELSESVSVTQMEERVEKKLTCHGGGRGYASWPGRTMHKVRLVVLLVGSDLTSKCEVATVRRWVPGCY